MKLTRKTILCIIPHRQFNDEEFLAVRDALKAEGCRFVIGGASLQEAVGTSGTRVRPSVLFSDMRVQDYDAIVFIGGIGAKDFWNHPRAHNIIRAFESHGKIIAGICVAPVTIANTGLLKDRSATCHPSVRRELEATGAHYTAQPVEVCGRIITATGPASATSFAEKIVHLLMPVEAGESA